MNSNQFKEALQDKNRLAVTWELVPGRGAREKSQENAIRAAEQAARGGRIDALSITDNPGGRPALSAACLGMEIVKLGIEPLVHFTCKDKNRNQIESELYALNRAGVNNLLIMTGDYPVSGFKGRPKPTFDLDSVQVMELVSRMNQGLEVNEAGKTVFHQPGTFFAGSVVSPFKASEAELMGQYQKLRKKISQGAGFIITQLGFDARKFHEVLQFVKNIDNDLPVIGNLYILPYGAARMMNANQLPGCVVPDKLLAQLDQERNAEDKGVGARLLRAAKMYALLKGLGFDGVDIGGHNIKYEQVEYIIDQGEELSADWDKLLSEFDYPQPQGFYFYARDTKTGLNTPDAVDRSDLPAEVDIGLNYRMMRMFHELFFTPDKNFYPLLYRYYARVKDPRRYKLEHVLKVIGNDCRDCGDCALLDLAYLCPMSQCPKNQRNGPCGGSYQGWCEVFPNEKKCVWVRVYALLKAYQEEDRLENQYLPPVNWDLYQTSAWYNYFAGRDHTGGNKKEPAL
ncbi:MAG TPA: methylenetetrahydrofolate reductase C-terminal domain-containing protein [Syntrophomonas sp.]|nr:methylenetetrahydrofolate reductase C-terminal domain-containing protein [Syntrophomonas sp.]HRW12734.1 methylenetetrahydrofolate reductase C-terminal domain-containing protein [Syntrophomonas sp.]